MNSYYNQIKHKKKILVDCWKCGKPFDIVTAERCYEHLNKRSLPYGGNPYEYRASMKWTTKCSHCGACICHKYNKMKIIDCEVLNDVGIKQVMPSVKRKLKRRL